MTTRRAAILQEFARAGRAYSDATVLFHTTVANRIGINPSDEKTLSVLQRLGPLSASEIAEQTGLAASSVTTLIDRLEAKGLVRRERDPRDRRRLTIVLAPHAAVAEQLFASSGQSLAELIAHYSDDELHLIADFLQRNAERLRAETTKLNSD